MTGRSRRGSGTGDDRALGATGSAVSPPAQLASLQPRSVEVPSAQVPWAQVPSLQVPSAQPPSAGDVSWTDEAGRRWTRRGGAVTTSRVRRLLARPEVRVVHVSHQDVRDVPLLGRVALRQRMEPYLKEAVRAAGDHTEFVVGQFREGNGDRLLVIEEYC